LKLLKKQWKVRPRGMSRSWTEKARRSNHWKQIPYGWELRGEAYGMWSGLPLWERILFLPFYVLQTTIWVLKGKDFHFVGIKEVEGEASK